MRAPACVIFVGPTLTRVRARALLDASYRGPAARGDVYRAALERPWGIGLIDGQLSGAPALLHKEILWALGHGIHVFGAAGLGALRAAELESFGMTGVGSVFEAFRSGALCDDDEVTVAVAPRDEAGGYRRASEALVDLRATLERARALRVLSSADAATMIDLAERLHFTARTYPSLFREAFAAGVERASLEQLGAWLPRHRRSLMREDAQLLLRVMSDRQRAQPGPRAVEFVFEHHAGFDAAFEHQPAFDAMDPAERSAQ